MHKGNKKNSKSRVDQKPDIIVQVLLSRENLFYAQWLKDWN
jgi:ornithine cyclodeaminase/alanine dehydrogenase-like protein (mu-crystallin family)